MAYSFITDFLPWREGIVLGRVRSIPSEPEEVREDGYQNEQQ